MPHLHKSIVFVVMSDIFSSSPRQAEESLVNSVTKIMDICLFARDVRRVRAINAGA
jgi:hypothetical protein